MSKFRHIQIKNGNEPKKRNQRLLEDTKSKTGTNFFDKSGTKTTKNGKEISKLNKSSETNGKRVKRISKDVSDDNSKKVRFNSQAQRKVKKPKEDLENAKKVSTVSTSFQKRKVNR